MKKTIILSILGFLVLSSCEDVIDVELPETETKLVVDGILRVDESQEFIDVEITMKETSNFFEDNQPTQVESAVIAYGTPNEFGELDSLGFSSLAEREPGSGVYVPDPNFSSDQRIRTAAAEPGVVFILQVTHNDRNYYARTEYAPTVPIDNLTQGTETLFDEDDTEVIVTFTDPPGLHDYYIFDFDFGEFLALRDEFIDGQQFQFSYFYDATLEPGEEATVSILGADQEFFNYMDLLVEQTENDGGIFDTPVATVRGNVFDVTGLDNINIFDNVERPEDFALGYFAVVQEFKRSITIE
ncbi:MULTISPECIES: DUF4249 family protein [Flavobacteriaceae]|uniref:DUF4249 family protein n=1 Tax=Flavobacteriaceae TaxID=49546 RepID=UPI001490A340|nr:MULTISPECIES: DUF4249 family protein [Allomuricauda]MDC6364996.1 DUF4249 family protein [Muricauda sp. AC10]